jgi:DNA-binding NtrC family response regulator
MEISETKPKRARKPPYCVLFIDDNQDIVEAFAAGLTAEGHYVHATTHGSDLLRLIAQFDPDVLVADVIMEEVDTFDVITILRRSHPNMKIIAISGNPHLLTLALKHGAHHTLAKPFPLHKLNLLIDIAMQA